MSILIEQPIRQALAPREDDSTLAVGALNHRLRVFTHDLSKNAKNGTPAGGVCNLRGQWATLEGTDDKIDYGDIGNIQEVSMWVNPGSTSEQLVQLDSGKTITVVAGTVTYTGITATATYVNNSASTTLAANEWQFLVCQFETTDANNFELGYDGTNYGDIDVGNLCAYTAARGTADIADEWGRGVPDPSLVLAVDGRGQDCSRYGLSCTPAGGVVTGGLRIDFDGTDDKIDCGDVGNIQEVEMWVDPSTTTQELVLIDTGKDIMVSAGTITYTGLTATATYVNGVATTTLAAGQRQHVVCQFETTDANNFEIGTDGANFGAFELGYCKARSTARGAAAVAHSHALERSEQ